MSPGARGIRRNYEKPAKPETEFGRISRAAPNAPAPRDYPREDVGVFFRMSVSLVSEWEFLALEIIFSEIQIIIIYTVIEFPMKKIKWSL